MSFRTKTLAATCVFLVACGASTRVDEKPDGGGNPSERDADADASATCESVFRLDFGAPYAGGDVRITSSEAEVAGVVGDDSALVMTPCLREPEVRFSYRRGADVYTELKDFRDLLMATSQDMDTQTFSLSLALGALDSGACFFDATNHHLGDVVIAGGVADSSVLCGPFATD